MSVKIYDKELPYPRRGCYERDNGDLIKYYPGGMGFITEKVQNRDPYEMGGMWRRISRKEHHKLFIDIINERDAQRDAVIKKMIEEYKNKSGGDLGRSI